MTDLAKRAVPGALGLCRRNPERPSWPWLTGTPKARRPSLQGEALGSARTGREGLQLRVALGPLGPSMRALHPGDGRGAGS